MATNEADALAGAKKLTEIANENAGSQTSGTQFLINAAMMRLGMMPPSYALYNPPPSFAEGGSTESSDDSSLKKLGDAASRVLGSHGRRLSTNIAKQFYGLDKNGNVVLGGRAWTSGQGGTPMALLDQFSSIPASLIPLINTLTPSPPPEVHAANKAAGVSDEFQVPKWSSDAAARLAALDERVKQTTGVGEPHTIPEHLEDAAAMLATPMPAAKVAKEAPVAQRILEMLTPLRPPTAGRFATDTAMLGGASAGLDALKNRLAPPAAPQDNTAHAGGGKVPSLLERLAALVEQTKDWGPFDINHYVRTGEFKNIQPGAPKSPALIPPSTEPTLPFTPKLPPEVPAMADGGKVISLAEKLAELAGRLGPKTMSEAPASSTLAPVSDMTARRAAQRGAFKNPDLKIPTDPTSGPNFGKPFHRFETTVGGANNNVGLIWGIHPDGTRVRVASVADPKVAEALASAYNSGGYDAAGIQKIPLSSLFKQTDE